MAAGWTKVGEGDLEQAERVTHCCIVSNQGQCKFYLFPLFPLHGYLEGSHKFACSFPGSL